MSSNNKNENISEMNDPMTHGGYNRIGVPSPVFCMDLFTPNQYLAQYLSI